MHNPDRGVELYCPLETCLTLVFHLSHDPIDNHDKDHRGQQTALPNSSFPFWMTGQDEDSYRSRISLMNFDVIP